MVYSNRVLREKLWRETWAVNPPVNSYILDDPTALVPGLSFPDVSGVSSTVSAVTLGDVQPVSTSGATLTIHYASVETLNLCHTS